MRLSRPGNKLDGTGPDRQGLRSMPKPIETDALSWPWWAPWALLVVAATPVLTVGATLYDTL